MSAQTVKDTEPSTAGRCCALPSILRGRRRVLPVLLLVLLAMTGVVQAHDPGLSRLELSVGRDAVDADLVLARRDLDALIILDADADGAVSAAELGAGRAALLETARSWVSLGTAGAPMRVIGVALDRSDGLHFRLQAPRPPGTALTVRCNAFAQLARGHRQYLHVKDPDGATLAAALLDAGAPAYSLSLRVWILQGFGLGMELGLVSTAQLIQRPTASHRQQPSQRAASIRLVLSGLAPSLMIDLADHILGSFWPTGDAQG